MIAGAAVASAGRAIGGGWDDRFQARGMDGPVCALTWSGTALYAGGAFGSVGPVVAGHVARWDGTAWSALGAGTDGTVAALAWDGTNLFAGGVFQSAGGAHAKNLARWDGTTWTAMHCQVCGMCSSVIPEGCGVVALAWDGANLYVGQNDVDIRFIYHVVERWDGATWTPIGGGWLEWMGALAWGGSSLYKGSSTITAWDGATWSVPGGGTNGGVVALVWDGASLYAGGKFTTAGGVPASNVARWDGASWSSLGTGTDDRVRALAWDGSALYAGGDFTTAGGVPAERIARWDGSTWTPLGAGTDDAVTAIAADGTTVHAGGAFVLAGGTPASHEARWDGTSWLPVAGTGEGLDGTVSCLAWGGSSLYAGGEFGGAGGAKASRVARWDGLGWSPLGAGIVGRVQAAIWDGSSLFVGGHFSTAGGAPARNVARWDGGSWSPLGSGLDGDVLALAWDGASMYAGGGFSNAGGVPASHVARWDGSSWSPLDAGVGGWIYALAWDGARLYAGGSFSTAGGLPAANVASWSGTSWAPLGAGTGPAVLALATSGGVVYAGGWFTTAGGAPASHVATWDGSTWSALGAGVDGVVWSLRTDGNDLHVGGDFATAGGVPASHVARWTGSAWQALGSGTDAPVYALALDASGVYAGGSFGVAGGRPSAHIGHFGCPPIAIVPPSLPPAVAGAAFSVALGATGGRPPYSFAATGTLPPGLTFTPAGILSGAPTTTGTFPFTVDATDADACTGSVDLCMVVSPPGCAPIVIDPAILADGQVGAPYAQTLTATGGTAPYTFSVGAGGTPPGVVLSSAGELSGTPLATGTSTFTVVATDAAGCRGLEPYALLVGTGLGNVVAGAGLGPPNPTRVRVFRGDGVPSGTDFLAYGTGAWGVSTAAGDVGADPRSLDQLLTGPGPGPVLGPHVRAFRREGIAVPKVSYYAYGTLRYGVNPGAGRLDGDGFDEMLTGAGAGVVFGPHVRGFDHDGSALAAIAGVNFFAYATLKQGVGIHRGDVDGDGFAEPLTGPGPGPSFGPQVRGWNYDGATLAAMAKLNFDAFPAAGYGVNLAGGSVDVDGFDELACATGPGPSLTPDFRGFGYDASRIAPLPGFVRTLSSTARHGGRLGLGDVTGDGVAELLAGMGREAAADARVFPFDHATGSLVPRPTFDAFPGSGYGVNVSAARAGY